LTNCQPIVNIVKPNLSPEIPLKLRFKSLKKISCDFKNQIALPLKSLLRTANGFLPTSESILALPDELLLIIFENIRQIKTVANFRQSCQRLNVLGNDQRLWKTLFKRFV
jgi:hypothetical protein